jgi:membrane protein required for colicin V production
MIWVDYAILAIIALSALISVVRGFVREVLSLVAWIVAFWVSLTFMHDVAMLLVDRISVPSVRLVLAFLALFITTLLVAGVVNFLIVKLVVSTGLSGTDRTLGILFGIARGGAIVMVLVLLAGLTRLPRDPWWQESLFLKHFETIALWMRSYLPEDVAKHFSF